MNIKGVNRHGRRSIHCADIESELQQASREYPLVVDFRAEWCP